MLLNEKEANQLFADINRLHERVRSYQAAAQGRDPRVDEELQIAKKCIEEARSELPGSGWSDEMLTAAKIKFDRARDHFEKARHLSGIAH